MKRFFIGAVVFVVLLGTFVAGYFVGKLDKQDADYLGLMYKRGQLSVVDGVSRIINQNKDVFSNIGNEEYTSRIYVYSMDGMDNKGSGDTYRTLWIRIKEGRFIIERATSFDEVPVD